MTRCDLAMFLSGVVVLGADAGSSVTFHKDVLPVLQKN